MSVIPRSPSEFFQAYLPSRANQWVKEAGLTLPEGSSVAVRILDHPGNEYSLRAENNRLVCSPGMADDVVLQVTVSQRAFELLFLPAAERDATTEPTSGSPALALRLFCVDQERASLVRQAVGSIALDVREGELLHRILLTPGAAAPEIERPTCRVQIDYQDFVDIQAGTALPFQLLMAGKILVQGNAQVLTAFASVLA